MFSDAENELIDAYVKYFELVEDFVKAQAAYEDSAAECRRIARKLPGSQSVASLGRYMHAAVERGDFGPDHVIARNLDRAIDMADDYLARMGLGSFSLGINGPRF